jgi:hypothetical protein
MGEADAFKAELEYERRRAQEILVECAESFKKVGEAFGSEVSPSVVTDLTEKHAQMIAHATVEALHRSGNGRLAAKWSAVYGEWRQANVRHREALERLREKPALTAEELTALEALKDTANDAGEAFERVQAEAETWFGNLGQV